jgi:hypothetical protein
MERSIAGRTAVGVLSIALLIGGMVVAQASAGSERIAASQVLELVNTLSCHEPSDCPRYRLRDTTGERSGWLGRSNEPLEDADGNEVGHSLLECFHARGTRTTCTQVISLTPGPYTGRGTIATTGILADLPVTFAVTGGTGAYANVGGEMTATSDPDGIRLTFNLTT